MILKLFALKLVESSLKVKVIIVVVPERKEELFVVIEIVGTTVLIVKESGKAAALLFPAKSVNGDLMLICAGVALFEGGVKVAV